MVQIDSNSMRVGTKIEMDDDVYIVTDLTHVTPGNKRGFNQTKLKSLTTGRVISKTIRASERVELADIEEKNMQFLYKDSDFHFMDTDTYEQVAIPLDALDDAANYIKENMEVGVVFWKGKAIDVNLPAAVELKVMETEPGLRGDTATNVTKPATVETGYVVHVPIFIGEGETIKVDTRSGEYLSRA